MLPRSERVRSGVHVVAVVALTVVVIAAFSDLRVDDAYITFRYGQNLARGLGMVFNPGQRVMGSTSPGEVLLTAVAYKLVGHDATPTVMAAAGCVGWIGQAIALHSMLKRRLGPLRAGIVAAGIAVGAAGSAQWVALETNLAAVATLAAFAFALRARWLWSAVACALAGLFRPDAYLACLPLGALCVRSLGRAAYKPALLFAFLAAPWPLVAALYYGSPIPQSAIVKYRRTSALAYALHELSDVPTQHLSATPLVAKVAFWLAAAAGGAILVLADRRLAAFVAYAALHAVAYILLAPDPAFTWHIYPLTLAAFVLVLVFVSTLVAKLPTGWRGGGAFAVAVMFGLGTWRFAQSHSTDVWFGARDTAYRKIAEYLRNHADPGDIVDAEEVGTLGYYTDLRMNDHARLVTPYPGDVFWRLTHRRTTKLRWLVLNGAQLELGRERPYYEGRARTLFTEGGWGFFVVDVRSSRVDGGKSEWD